MDPLITIDSTSSDRRTEVDSLRHDLGLQAPPEERVRPGEIRLVLHDHHVEVMSETSVRRGTRVDFSNVDTRTGSGNISRNQLLGRAVADRSARRTGASHSIIDATAGFGHDAFMLACMGHDITAIECNPVIHFLLQSSIRNAESDPLLSAAMGDRLRSIHGDSVDILSGHAPVDTVYLDPMFEVTNHRSALPKKRAQLLRLLAGSPRDSCELFDAAMSRATRRVVVKRSTGAEPLVARPDHSVSGKIARYDIYLINRSR